MPARRRECTFFFIDAAMVDIMEVLNNMSITTAVIIGISAGALLFGFEYGINRLVMKYFPEDKPESLDGTAAAPAPAS